MMLTQPYKPSVNEPETITAAQPFGGPATLGIDSGQTFPEPAAGYRPVQSAAACNVERS